MKPLTRLLRPDSLFGQLLFMMLLGAAVLQCVNFYAVFSIQRSYGREFFSVGRDYISSMYRATRLMGEEQRAAFLAELSKSHGPIDRSFRFKMLEEEPKWQTENSPKAHGVRSVLRGAGAYASASPDIRVRILHETSPEAGDPRYSGYLFPLLQVAARMDDGTWMELVQSLIMTDSRLIWRQRVLILIGSLVISIVTILMVRRATRPLRKLGLAAETIGRGPELATPLCEEEGSIEVREAAQSFNRMLRRICDSINERNGMLEAMGHDLRTPLARIQLRLGKIQPESLREKFAANINEIQSIVEQGLELASSLHTSEKVVTLDVVAFLESVVDDMQAQGARVSLDVAQEDGGPLLVSARPTCLRRSIENLVVNAVNYAGMAHISVGGKRSEVAIDIDDDGPGIPDELLEKVFEPYYRLEDSRNRGSGGTGLGLSIARNMLLLNGGSVNLANRPDGGLRVHVTLPRGSAQKNR